MYTFIQTYLYMYTYIYTHLYIFTPVNIFIYIYLYIYTHAHVHCMQVASLRRQVASFQEQAKQWENLRQQLCTRVAQVSRRSH